MNSTHPLRIVNGEFMRGNNIEKPEIGNREQIECLQAHEKAAQKAAEEAETSRKYEIQGGRAKLIKK